MKIERKEVWAVDGILGECLPLVIDRVIESLWQAARLQYPAVPVTDFILANRDKLLYLLTAHKEDEDEDAKAR